MQVKIFTSSFHDQLEQEINKWMQGKEFENIQFVQTMNDSRIVLSIFFELVRPSGPPLKSASDFMDFPPASGSTF